MTEAEAGAAKARALLAEAGAGGKPRLDIAEAALACAVLDRASARELGPARAHLAELALKTADVAAGQAQDPALLAGALAEVLAGSFGYRGDTATYDDLANADLISVIARRKGLPVALGILWIHAARAAGGDARGLAFPGHFLVAVGPAAGAAIVDPFHGGRILDEPDLERLARSVTGGALAIQHLTAAPDAAVLIRLQNNIKSRALAQGQIARALAVQERMALLAPQDGEIQLDLGRLAEANGQIGQALAAFAAAAQAAAPGSATAQEAAAAAGRLRRKLH